MTAFRGFSKMAGLRALAFAWALFGVWIAMACFLDLSMAGFPDGYISPYARATGRLLEVLAWLCLAQSLYFAFRGLRSRPLGLASLGLQIIVAAALTVVPIKVVQKCPQWEGCSRAYQALTGTMMDDGTGG